MRYLLILSSLLIALQVTTASADDISKLQDKIDSLEKDLNTMQQQVYRGNKSYGKTSGNAANLEAQSVAFEEDMRRLNGKIEESENSSNKIAAKLEKALADIDFRLTAMEKSIKELQEAKTEKAEKPEAIEEAKAEETKAEEPASTETPEEKPGAAETPLAPAKKETAKKEEPNKEEAKKETKELSDAKGQYDKALEAMRKTEYDKAERSFKDFIAGNKGNELLSNAYYWLGETYYVRENYNQSAVQFLKGYQDNPKGNKAADNLLKLAMSLNKLKKQKEACTTLDKLTKEFPKVDATTKEKVKKERTSAKCS
ncbi:MAG: uncharacterized protein K0R98_1384 [Rickettsiaceae bacterium]|nr:uncharacterized protein [Rickettsiaceae bacterium]